VVKKDMQNMDYLYENLGDERFQEFCSTLIAKEFPNMQAFPVGQPDGGRDSLVYLMDSPKKSFIVFQVKFVKNPKSLPDAHKWLIGILRGEIEKIEKLIPKGAKEYYLLTNVDGTAHLNTGSKDKANEILEDSIPIPAQCWWREDISRRFEKDPIFKWSFPEILNGQDILNSLIFQNINENKENREAVINAYLTDQYKLDNEVKFKQIDLQNKLIDLYTDVPLRIKAFNRKNKKLKNILDYFNVSNRSIIEEESLFHRREEGIGAANFLLNPLIQNGIERILLEGGPGQGKSTMSQYICQVHRARLLNKTDDLNLLPENIYKCPMRIPFKIDLRHIASWVEKKNPYSSLLSDDLFNRIWSKSLESFMIGHISYHSPNHDFIISDLIAIIKNHPILIVFDGFDEIADINARQEVIDFIDRGIERLKANTKFIQILITSRPAAFSNTSSFPIDVYPHFELTDITSPCITEYVKKWIKANKMDNRDGNEIKRLVEEKLQIPHLRELAKNPMQLAIFLSLLKTRGESLPNKRTALYDSYIDLFFNREAEKNQEIRDKRDLIIDIHKYLAWVLHSEAELYKNNGSITLEQLIDKLKNYLEKEGHATDIAESLFQVVKERVCALVSRVQGTYEFEVQPLREYFCAKYLYETAPYSPPGDEKKGTKPERFNAIARDFYWNNVVRFYSGCFDKGELPMLVDEIKELQRDSLLKYTNYPRLLTSQLLSDYVFTQYPKYLKDVVKIIVDGINIGGIINQNSRFRDADEPISLPNECGRIEIIKECFEQLKHLPHNDYVTELIGLIVNNPCEEALELWKAELQNFSSGQTLEWFEYAYRMQIIHKIEKSILSDIVSQDTNLSSQERKLQIIINGNRFDVINHNIQLKQIALEGILNGKIFAMPHRKKDDSSLQSLSMLLHPFIVDTIIYEIEDKNGRFLDVIRNRFRFFDMEYDDTLGSETYSSDDIDNSVKMLYDSIGGDLKSNLSDWKHSLRKWDFLIEKFRNLFGDKWAFKILSTIIAGIKDENLPNEKYYPLSDASISLCKRAKYARNKSGYVDYWKQQFNQSVDLLFICLMFFTWATPRVFTKLYDKLQDVIAQFSKDDILLLSNSLMRTTRHNILKKLQAEEIIDFLQSKPFPLEIKYLITYRFPGEIRENFICSQDNNIQNIFGIEIAKTKFESLIKNFFQNTENKLLLSEIKECYQLFSNYDINDEYIYHHYIRFRDDNNFTNIPLDIARDIMEEPISYPRIIASMAEKSCRVYANKNINIVGKAANDDHWFD
jgi:archaellum biogenesis ATPase FlaH